MKTVLRGNWEDIKQLQVTGFSRTFVGVLVGAPVLKRCLSSLEGVTGYEWRVPFSARLLYVGALLYIAGALVYRFSCPGLVRDHSNLGSFRRSGSDYHNLVPSLQSLPREDLVQIGINDAQGSTAAYTAAQAEGMFWGVWNKLTYLYPVRRRIAQVLLLSAYASAVVVLLRQVR